jgi:hypothetical protein
MAAVLKDTQMRQLPSVSRTLVRALRSERQPTGRGDCGRQPCVPTHTIHPHSSFCLYRRSLAPCVIDQGVLVLLDRHLHITLSLA